MKNILWSNKRQGDVNHITGDIHYVALVLSKRKTILTIHDLNFLNNPNPLNRLILKIFWITLPLRKVAYVTVISEATKKDLLSRVKFPEEKIKVISNFYNPLFSPSPKEFNRGEPRVLQIGTKDNKNLNRLIEALNGIRCHLIIIGGRSGFIEERLEQFNIHYTWVNNLSDTELVEQYRQCDLLSFVSTIEGFGMPILEAQGVGRAVVTSNISSMPEVAGDGACYVDPFDINSIKRGFLKLIQDDIYRNNLVEKGYNNIKRFDLKKIAAMYCDLYNEVRKGSMQ